MKLVGLQIENEQLLAAVQGMFFCCVSMIVEYGLYNGRAYVTGKKD
jgi:hypothetical protein